MKPRLAAALLLGFAALTPAGPSAREGADNPCPAITVSCPAAVLDGKPVTFTVSIGGADPAVAPGFKWSVSSGRITGGQGTPEIKVERDGTGTLTATVEVVGYHPLCAASSSCTSNVRALPRSTEKVDEYGDVGAYEEGARLGSFAHELLHDPNAAGYVIVYAGRRAREGEARAWGEKVRSYLVNGWGIEADRLFVVDGGHRETRAVELFIVPAEAAPPSATPTVHGADVEIIKGASEARPSKRRGRQPRGHDRR